MPKAKERTELDKKNWTASFNLVGKVKINNNTFTLDQKSNKSDWCYSRANIGIDCGEEYGTIYAQMMGGYGVNRDNVIYVVGKTEDGRADFSNSYTIDWEDRFDEDILKDVATMQFIRCGIERDSKGKIFYKNFLSEYDAIAYLAEHLKDGEVVSVRGNLEYQLYNGNLTVNRNINSIVLSTREEKDFSATFIQTVLLDSDSAVGVDKEKKTYTVSAYVLEKLREYNGHDLTEGGKVKGGKFVPLRKEFEYAFPADQEKAKKAISYLFKIKKDVTQITFEGVFKEGGATVETTWDDVPDDIRELVSIGILSEEEALATCATNASRERRMIFTKPYIKKQTDNDGNVTALVQKFDAKYTDDDLALDYLVPVEADNGEDEDEEVPFDEEDSSSDSDDDWLDDLG